MALDVAGYPDRITQPSLTSTCGLIFSCIHRPRTQGLSDSWDAQPLTPAVLSSVSVAPSLYGQTQSPAVDATQLPASKHVLHQHRNNCQALLKRIQFYIADLTLTM